MVGDAQDNSPVKKVPRDMPDQENGIQELLSVRCHQEQLWYPVAYVPPQVKLICILQGNKRSGLYTEASELC